MRIDVLAWIGIGVLGTGIATAVLITYAAAPVTVPSGAIQHDVQHMQWSPAPASMPAGAQIILLEGDPKAEGLFTLRLKLPAGSRLPPHWHPRDERVTVLSGRIGVGFGAQFSENQLRYFEAGSYYVNPTPMPHFVFFPVETVAQITGIGPWQTHLLPDASP